MRIGIAADHGGFILKGLIVAALQKTGYEFTDFGAKELNPDDDYPDFVVPMARAVAEGKLDRGVAICSSGVGASIAANKIPGVRAALIHDDYSAIQGVEDDDMNIICFGSLMVCSSRAQDMIRSFLAATFSGEERHRRRLAKVAALERTGGDNGRLTEPSCL